MPYRYKIVLETMADAVEFVAAASKFNDNVKIVVVDNNGMRVNGRSLMGMIYSLEFVEMWCESNTDIYNAISKFII